MTQTKEFHLGDILTVTTGALLSPRHMDGIYEILDWMTDESLMTHQLPRVSDECKPFLLEQYPALADIELPEKGVIHDQETLMTFLETFYPIYGEMLAVRKLRAINHTHIDPLVELSLVAPNAKVIVVEVPDA